jgi:hypothetical protein
MRYLVGVGGKEAIKKVIWDGRRVIKLEKSVNVIYG